MFGMDGMEIAVVFLRTAFGVWNLFFGVVFFFNWPIPQPMGHGKKTPYLNQTLIDTKLFHVVKVIEIIVGLALIFNVGVPLALCAYFPITIVIFHTNMFLEEDFKPGPWIAVAYLAVHLFLLWAYRDYYMPMLTMASHIAR